MAVAMQAGVDDPDRPQTFAFVGYDGEGRQQVGSEYGLEHDVRVTLRDVRRLTIVSLAPAHKRDISVSFIQATALHWWSGLPFFMGPALLKFFRSMALLCRSDPSLKSSVLVSASSCRNPRLKQVLESVHADMDTGGKTFVQALRGHPAEFRLQYVEMIAAAFAGADFKETLRSIVALETRRRRTGNTWMRILAYPAFIMAATLLLVAQLATSFIPRLDAMRIEDTKLKELPWDAVVLEAFGRAIASPVVIGGILTGLGGIALLVSRFARTEGGGVLFDRVRWAIPVLGPILKKNVVSRFCSQYTELRASSVGELRALELVRNATGSRRFAQVTDAMHESKRTRGGRLSELMLETRFFDLDLCSLVAAGEKASDVMTPLRECSADYDDDFDTAMKATTSVTEPLLIVFCGGLVGAVLMATYHSLYTVMGRVQ